MAAASSLPRLLLRERTIVLGAVAAVSGLAWLYMLRLGHGLVDLLCLAVPAAAAWTPADFALSFAMWSAMMTGMMLPTAAPMLLTFAAVQRDRPAPRHPGAPPRWPPSPPATCCCGPAIRRRRPCCNGRCSATGCWPRPSTR